MKAIIGLSTLGLVVVVSLITLCMWGCPQYSVYEQRLVGEAELARATYNRQVKIREAEATKESAALYAQAEVERAKGVAKANEIIGSSLKDNHEYLTYLWIHGLQDKDNNVIYVPTEANLPLLEAGKRR